MSLHSLLRSEIDNEFSKIEGTSNKKKKSKKNNSNRPKGILKKRAAKTVEKKKKSKIHIRPDFLTAEQKRDKKAAQVEANLSKLLSSNQYSVPVKATKAIVDHTAKNKRQLGQSKANVAVEQEDSVFTEEDFAAWEAAPFINSEVGGPKKKEKKKKAKKPRKSNNEEMDF